MTAIHLISEFIDQQDATLNRVLESIQTNASQHSVMLFVSPKIDPNKLEKALANSAFKDRIIGCSTAGEITTSGYADGAISGICFDQKLYPNKTFVINDLSNFSEQSSVDLMPGVNEFVREQKLVAPNARAFAILLIDGVSKAEEIVVSHLTTVLPKVSIIGGSAGDGLNFKKTYIFANGALQSNAALLSVFVTERPVEFTKTQHFMPSEEKMVITSADPSKRIVFEINGAPAGEEYARLLNLNPSDLTPATFAKNPVCSRHGGEYFVRAIKYLNPDGSLTFYCAIEEGLVLTLSKGLDFVKQTEEALLNIKTKLPELKATLAFECILRRIEVLEHGLLEDINRIYRDNSVIGFHTYGEQLGAVHINQTLTAVSFG